MTISADEKTLYLVLQSPLYNPDKKTGDASRHTRVLVFDIASEKPIAEYVYRFDAIKDFAADPKLGPDEMKLSAVALVNRDDAADRRTNRHRGETVQRGHQ